MTHESLGGAESCPRPRGLTDTLFSWTDRAPWWVLVLVGLGILVFLFIISPARMTVDRQVPAVGASAAGSFTYTLEVKNAGPAEAVSISLTEQLPEGLTFTSANPAPTSTQDSLLQWDLPAIKGQRSTVVELTVTARGATAPAEFARQANADVTWTTVSIDILRFLALGVRVTILVTLYSFVLAVILGLVAGLGRVSKQPPGLSSVLQLEYVWKGALRAAAGIAAYFVLGQVTDKVPPLTVQSAVVVALVMYLAPRVLHPYTLARSTWRSSGASPCWCRCCTWVCDSPFAKTFLSEMLGNRWSSASSTPPSWAWGWDTVPYR